MAEPDDMPMLRMWLLNSICAVIKHYERESQLVVRRVEIFRDYRAAGRPAPVSRVEAEIADREA